MKPLRTPILLDLDRTLRAAADPAHRAAVRDHFGSNVDRFHGVKMPVIRECASAALAGRKIALRQRWAFCDELTSSGIFEHKIAAFHWAWQVRREWEGSELPRFAQWLNKACDDWMDTDDLCIRVIGEFFLRFPEQACATTDWSRMTGTWSRRGSAVALIPSARRQCQWPVIETVARNLMNDPKALVGKACGWLLKVTSRKDPEKVRRFVDEAGAGMAPLVRRIALEKLGRCVPT